MPPELHLVRWYFERRQNGFIGLSDNQVRWNEALWQLVCQRGNQMVGLTNAELVDVVTQAGVT